jgi:5-methylcytosine-specific restriction protein B
VNAWDEVLAFSKLFVQQVDLAHEEREYKLQLASGLMKAREQLLDGQRQWFETLRREISRTNLVNQYFMMALIKAETEHPDALGNAVRDFWSGTPTPEHLDKLEHELRELNSVRLSSGGAVGFGSLLLMAMEPEKYPPFRARRTSEFMKLVGVAPLGAGAKPSERYQQLLETLDVLREKAHQEGLPGGDRLDAQGLLWTLMNVDPDDSWPAREAKDFRAWRGDKEKPKNETSEFVRGSGKSPVTEDAAWKILGPALSGEFSPIDGITTTWTEAAASRLLLTRDTQDPESGGYLERLHAQLAGSDNSVYLLAAELTYLQCVALSNTGPAKKIERINTVLGWAPGGPAQLPSELADALQCPGAFNGGQGFNMHIAAHVGWLLRFVKHLEGMPREDVNEALSSPWKWIDLTATVPDDVPTMRYTIDYLVWPNYFQPVVVKEDRKRIRDAFAHLLGGPRGNAEVDIAQDLHEIQQIHGADGGHYAEWYAEPYRSQWVGHNGPSQKAWLVRQAQAGRPMAETWIAEGIISLPSQPLPAEISGEGFETVFDAVKSVYGHITYSDQKEKARELHRFATQMQEGDLVIAPWEDVILVGVVSSQAYFADFAGPKFCRTVDWHRDPVDNADLPEPLPRLLSEAGTIVDVSPAILAIDAWVQRPTGADVVPEPTAPPKPRTIIVPQLRNASDELASELYVARNDLQEMIDLLRTRRQVVLYGPPGTGKTFIGKRLAQFLAGREHADHVQIVQFHPSYAYEDFFEGYRPNGSANGQVGFELQHGPLRRLAAMASDPANASQPFFLIIDEMNRGNLAKVFGELYFLLEYRNDSIRLQYSPGEEFTLPPNLFMISTMNTADRSIAMVDAAIRRRFAFVELHPQDGVIAGTLARFLAARGRPTLAADLLEALNSELGIDKRDLAVGPSYFMREDAFDAAGLRRVWKYELLPLLEEYHFGELDRDEVHERFALDALLFQMGRSLDELNQPNGADDEE